MSGSSSDAFDFLSDSETGFTSRSESVEPLGDVVVAQRYENDAEKKELLARIEELMAVNEQMKRAHQEEIESVKEQMRVDWEKEKAKLTAFFNKEFQEQIEKDNTAMAELWYENQENEQMWKQLLEASQYIAENEYAALQAFFKSERARWMEETEKEKAGMRASFDREMKEQIEKDNTAMAELWYENQEKEEMWSHLFEDSKFIAETDYTALENRFSLEKLRWMEETERQKADLRAFYEWTMQENFGRDQAAMAEFQRQSREEAEFLKEQLGATHQRLLEFMESAKQAWECKEQLATELRCNVAELEEHKRICRQMSSEKVLFLKEHENAQRVIDGLEKQCEVLRKAQSDNWAKKLNGKWKYVMSCSSGLMENDDLRQSLKNSTMTCTLGETHFSIKHENNGNIGEITTPLSHVASGSEDMTIISKDRLVTIFTNDLVLEYGQSYRTDRLIDDNNLMVCTSFGDKKSITFYEKIT